MVKEDGQELSYSKSIFIGLGFFIITASWSLYNSYVPIFLKKFIEAESMIGIIMTFDNIAAITLQPYFGALSDNKQSKFGHRLPFIIIGVPIAAIFFAVIPLANSFLLLLIVLVIMNLAMSIFRSPTIALMPDLTPPPLRSKANGLINFMGGIGAVLTYLLGSYLYDIDPFLPFALMSVLLILVLFLFLWKLKEPQTAVKEDRINIIKVIKKIFTMENRNILYILLAIFFWFYGYSAIEAFFTLYGKEFLLIKESIAARTLLFFSLSFVIFAIPSGYLATKIGRKRTIRYGIIGLLLTFVSLVFLRNVLYIRLALLIGGFFWAFININSYPLVVDAADGKIGTYTGVYYFFATLPAILSPMIVGKIIEVFGYGSLFINAVVAFGVALYCVNKFQD